MTFELDDLKFIKWKSYTEFKLNNLCQKHVEEKCG